MLNGQYNSNWMILHNVDLIDELYKMNDSIVEIGSTSGWSTVDHTDPLVLSNT